MMEEQLEQLAARRDLFLTSGKTLLIAATLLWVAELPPHLNINALELMPVNQSWQGFAVHRHG